MTTRIVRTFFIFLTVMMLPTGSASAGSAFFAKGGAYTMSDDEANIEFFTIAFDKESNNVLSLGGEYRFDNGFAIGGELFSFSNDWTQGGFISNDGDLDVLAGMVVAKKIFNSSSSFRPYIGGGIALLDATLGSGSGGSGIGAHALLGVEISLNGFIVMLEGKGISGKVADVDNEKIDVSGSGYLLGLGWEF